MYIFHVYMLMNLVFLLLTCLLLQGSQARTQKERKLFFLPHNAIYYHEIPIQKGIMLKMTLSETHQ